MHDLDKIIDFLSSHDKFIVTAHVRPDGDAVGSVAGLCRSMRKTGKTVHVCINSDISDTFAKYLDDETMLSAEDLTKPPVHYDGIIALDSGDFDRTGVEDELKAMELPVINIDHHPTNPLYGNMNLVKVTASSTSEIITMILKKGGFPFDLEVAEPLYLGILTDSGFFQNDSLNPETFRVIAELLEAGVDPAPIISGIRQNKSIQDIRALGLGLSKAQFAHEGKIVYTVLNYHELEALGAVPQNCWNGGLFRQLNVIGNAYVAVTFIEDQDGTVFCEFRSKYNTDVKNIAVHFGGGGHHSASGCSQKKPVDEFKNEVLDFVAMSLEQTH